jgi:probable H4MPT-linked C1 transfer pathway protein
MAVVGLDVGGANLKVAHTTGRSCTRPFALWKAPERLADELRAVLAGCPAFDRAAVTLTGELCDCFESKRQGVTQILDAVEAVVGGKPVSVWTNEGAFVGVDRARHEALNVASANWLAQATFVAARLPTAGAALLIDLGTTTTDVVPLSQNRPIPRGRTDPERLRCGELIYRGWRRTPFALLMNARSVAELFATAHDAMLVLGLCDEDPLDRDTADGRPATRESAHRRIARMLCADLETTTEQERLQLAREAHARLLDQIRVGSHRVRLQGVEVVIASGSGSFLIPELVGISAKGRVSFELAPFERFAPAGTSAVACAYAVAVLCQEMTGA